MNEPVNENLQFEANLPYFIQLVPAGKLALAKPLSAHIRLTSSHTIRSDKLENTLSLSVPSLFKRLIKVDHCAYLNHLLLTVNAYEKALTFKTFITTTSGEVTFFCDCYFLL